MGRAKQDISAIAASSVSARRAPLSLANELAMEVANLDRRDAKQIALEESSLPEAAVTSSNTSKTQKYKPRTTANKSRRWHDPDIELALRQLSYGKDSYPMEKEFIAAGLGGLHSTIRRRQGHAYWADKLGYEEPSAKLTIWTPEKTKQELEEYMLLHKSMNPKTLQAEHIKLYGALSRQHSSIYEAAKFYGYPYEGPRRRTREDVLNEVKALIGNSGQWPTKKEFLASSGGEGLYTAAKKLGGGKKLAQEVGVEAPDRLARVRENIHGTRWTDELIQERLLELIGDSGKYPSDQLFVETGNTGVSSKIYATKGHLYWANKLGVTPRMTMVVMNDDQLEAALRGLISKVGGWPTMAQMEAEGTGLYTKMMRRGGAPAWRTKIIG